MRYVVLLLLVGCSLDSSAIGSKPPKRDISKLLDAGGVGVIVFDADADAAPELEDGEPEDSGAAGSGPMDAGEDAAEAEDASMADAAAPDDAAEPDSSTPDASEPPVDTGTPVELHGLCEPCSDDADCKPRHLCLPLGDASRCYPLKEAPSDPPCSSWGASSTIYLMSIDRTICTVPSCDNWIAP